MKIPLTSAIIELLQKKGTISDSKLLEDLKKTYGDISTPILNKALMRLEIEGLIRVSSLARSEKNIELIQKPGE